MRRLIRKPLSYLAAGSIALASVAVAQPAQASPNRCAGTRAEARAIAAGGDMVESARSALSVRAGATGDEADELRRIVDGIEDYSADVVLRYSPSSQCAYGLIGLSQDWRSAYVESIYGPSVWMDTSFDLGQTISLGLVNERVVPTGYSSTYTATFSFTPYAMDRTTGGTAPFSIRACGKGVHTVASFTGKYNRKLKLGGPSLSTEIVDNPVVCTDWLHTYPQ